MVGGTAAPFILGITSTSASQNLYPQGCETTADNASGSWQYLCYLGAGDWDTDSWAILGTSLILNWYFFQNNVACNLDTSAVKDYQLSRGLSVDGTVGPQTYTSLQSTLLFDYTQYGISTFGQPTEQLYYSIGWTSPDYFMKNLLGGGVEPNNLWMFDTMNPQTNGGGWKWLEVDTPCVNP